MPFKLTIAGLPYSLVGKSVQFTAQKLEGYINTIDHAGAVVDGDGSAGTGHYAFEAGDTDQAGHYLVRWTVVEDLIDIPVDAYDHLIVSPELPV
jgi:hypothetical protein